MLEIFFIDRELTSANVCKFKMVIKMDSFCIMTLKVLSSNLPLLVIEEEDVYIQRRVDRNAPCWNISVHLSAPKKTPQIIKNPQQLQPCLCSQNT